MLEGVGKVKWVEKKPGRARNFSLQATQSSFVGFSDAFWFSLLEIHFWRVESQKGERGKRKRKRKKRPLKP